MNRMTIWISFTFTVSVEAIGFVDAYSSEGEDENDCIESQNQHGWNCKNYITTEAVAMCRVVYSVTSYFI